MWNDFHALRNHGITSFKLGAENRIKVNRRDFERKSRKEIVTAYEKKAKHNQCRIKIYNYSRGAKTANKKELAWAGKNKNFTTETKETIPFISTQWAEQQEGNGEEKIRWLHNN